MSQNSDLSSNEDLFEHTIDDKREDMTQNRSETHIMLVFIAINLISKGGLCQSLRRGGVLSKVTLNAILKSTRVWDLT